MSIKLYHHGSSVCAAKVRLALAEKGVKWEGHYLAILCESRPVCDELLYIHHEKGFVLCSMRSPSISRYAVQCGVHDTVEDWSEDRIWGEISERLPREVATTLDTGSCVDKSIVPLKVLLQSK